MVVVILLCLVICPILGYMVGVQRGQGTLGLVLGLFLGPIGILIAVLLPAIRVSPY